jgi:hypothetical protein
MHSTGDNSAKETNQASISIASLHSNVYVTPIAQSRKKLVSNLDSSNQQEYNNDFETATETNTEERYSNNWSQKCSSPTARQRRREAKKIEDTNTSLYNNDNSPELAEVHNSRKILVAKPPMRNIRKSFVTVNFEMLLGSDSVNSAEEENLKLFEQLKVTMIPFS